MSTGLDLVHERKGQVFEAKIRKSKGKSLVVDAKLNTVPLKAVIDTAAMLTLVNWKYVENQNGDHETVQLKGKGGHNILQSKITHWPTFFFLGLQCCCYE